MNPKLINNQDALDDLVGSYDKYGSIAANACGAIAITNVCILDGMGDVTLDYVIKKLLSRHGGTVLRGLLGTNPSAIVRTLKDFGFDAKYLGAWRNKEQLKGYRYFIVLYGWRNGCTLGAHYQAGQILPNGMIELYNYYHQYKDVAQFKQFEKPILPVIYGIK